MSSDKKLLRTVVDYFAKPEHKNVAPNFEGYMVIGAGLPRTGTMSMQAALEIILKGPCYHMLQVWEGTEKDWNHWEKTHDGKASDNDWKALLEERGFRAGVDYPISHHFETLMRVFPNAKVVLTIRDPQKWYASVKATIFQVRDFVHGTIGLFLQLVGMLRMVRIANTSSQQKHPGYEHALNTAIAAGKDESVKFYTSWVKHVKETVPEERLLVFEVKQGWEPLCKFLNLPIPEQPFPHINDTPAMLWNMKKLRIMSYVTIYGIPILIAILFAAIIFSEIFY